MVKSVRFEDSAAGAADEEVANNDKFASSFATHEEAMACLTKDSEALAPDPLRPGQVRASPRFPTGKKGS